jgi:THO complex subunit 2
MHVYNAIIVLKEVLPVFPVAAASGTAGYSLVTVLDRLLEKEERGDLKILARAYHASLKKRESIWSIPTDHKSAHAPMRFDSPARTSTPSGPGQDLRPAGQSANPPSAPRSHVSSANNGIVAPVQPKANQSINSAKAALESVPRPDFIKRVGRGDKMDTTPDHPSITEVNKSGTPQPTREPPTGPAKHPTQPRRSSPVHAADARRDFAYSKDHSRPPSPSETSHSSARDRGPDDRRESPQSTMPPPTIPSQKPSAHELRETAKNSLSSRLPDKLDMDKSSHYDQNGHPPRRRSVSPSRPGTRNPSLDSRGSAGQSRSAGEDERRDSRSGPSRRESARLERNARDRPSGRDGRESDREDRERDRERDRHGERERKERDRNDRERERERERDRERERERERDRDRNGGRDSRDRHRRDERDRKERPAARESAREQRDSGWESARELGAATPAAPAETPTRASDAPSRHRSATKGEDGLGKRRRPADDDVSPSPVSFRFPCLS